MRQVMQDVIDCLGATLAGLTITSIVAPVVVVVLAPVAWAFDAIRRRFIATSREIKRLDSLALSPILSTFSETLQVPRMALIMLAQQMLFDPCISAPLPLSMLWHMTVQQSAPPDKGTSTGYISAQAMF